MQQQDEKDIFIDNMKKLIMTINNNKFQQNKIFDSLSKEDINKIFSNFEHEDKIIRKISARLISQLLYNNNQLKEKLCEVLQIHPRNTNIIFNKISKWLRQSPAKLFEVIKFIKNDNINSYGEYLCWYIDPKSTVLSIKYVGIDSFPFGQYIDPNELIFGITYIQSQKIKLMNNRISFKQPQLSFELKHNSIKTISEKTKFNFTSRERGNTTFQQFDYQPSQKIGQLSFKNQKGRFSNTITQRSKLNSTSPMAYSIKKPRQSEIEKTRIKPGIQITSPTSVTSNPIKFRSQKSEDRHIIILGGKHQSKQLTNSVNITSNKSNQQRVYTFNTSRTPPPNTSSNNSSTPRTEYPKVTQFKLYQKQQSQTKMYSDYKPSDSFLRKIKDSYKN